MAEFKVATAYADFEVRVDQGIDQAVARIRSRQKELDVTATLQVDADTELARRRIKELGDTKERATVQADADTALARAKIKALGDEKIASPKIKPEVDQSAADKAESDLGRVAARANAQFSAMSFGALSVGLPAAAAVGAAGVTAALASVGAGFIGLQAVYARNEDAVRRSFAAVSQNVTQSMQQMSVSAVEPLSHAADDVGAAFGRIRPQLDTAFKNSDAQIQPLTKGITNLAENAMPGLVTATAHLQDPIKGLSSLLAQTGSGLSDFFTNASAGSRAAGQEMSTLGGIVRDAMGFLGQLFANVSNNGAPALSQLQAMLREAEGALTALTATGSGAIGFLHGFGSAATGMLATINLIAHGLALLPPELTQFGGSVAASAMILSKFGIDAGKSFDGLGAKIKEQTTLSGKFGAAVDGLVAGAMNPATLAVAGFGLAMDLLGTQQQKAAQAAQQQAERVQSLAQALRESKGAVDENVQSAAAQALQNMKVGDSQQNMLDVARELGINLSTLNSAYLGSSGALKELDGSQMAAVTSAMKLHAEGPAGSKAAEDQMLKYQAFFAVLDGGDFAKAAQQNKNLADATAAGAKPVTELSSAMETLQNSASATADKVTALRSALDILSGRTPIFEDGLKAGNDSLRTMADSLKNGTNKADGFGASLVNVDGTVNTVTKNGSALQGLAEGLQGSFVNAASGIDQMVRRGVPFAQATSEINSNLTQQRDRFVELAQKMGLTAAQAQALADKYGLIPQTITTNISADTKQAQAAIDALPPYAAGTRGAIVLSAVTDPATGRINETVQYANGSTGYITLDGIRDPVTGKTLAAVQYANGSTGTMTIDALNQLAKDGALDAVRYADGRVGTVTIKADTVPARNSFTAFMDDFMNQVITVKVRTQQVGAPPLPLGGNAVGGLVGGGTIRRFATGGVTGGGTLQSLDANPGNLAVDGTNGGRFSGPGTGTSDSMLAVVSNTEAIINAKATAANLSELAAINNGHRNYEKYPDTGRPGGSGSTVVSTRPVTINLTVTQRDTQDSEAFVQQIARALEQRMKVA